MSERWNHNIHYHRSILDVVPRGGRVLDVGCGEGMLAREFGRRGDRVVGVDLDARSIELAQATTTDDVEYVRADVLTHPFERGSFDAVVSVATLHHLGAETGLRRFAELVRPGGVVAVVGIARSVLPRDLAREVIASVATRGLRLTRTYWEHSAPTVWPPPETYREVAAIASEVLPGSTYRRRVLWRYTIDWTRPSPL